MVFMPNITTKHAIIITYANPISGLLSLTHSDWLSYYKAICYSPLVAKRAGFLAAKKDSSVALTS